MKLLCLAFLVLLGHQALANPRTMTKQATLLNPVPAENIKVNLELTTRNSEATTGNQETTTRKPWVIEPRHENVVPLAHQNVLNQKWKQMISKLKSIPVENLKGCKEGEFQCDADLCVSEAKRCDGRVNCADGTDEDDCSQVDVVDETMKRESRQGCAELSQTSGAILCPNGGGNYQNNGDFCWIIRAGLPMTIRFTSFHVETNYDYVKIRDGDSSYSSVIGEFTGHTIPKSVETSGKAAYIRFTSDYSITFPGFKLHWAPSDSGKRETHQGCKEGEFKCDADLCVSEAKRCDGRVNCEDGTDEDDCLVLT